MGARGVTRTGERNEELLSWKAQVRPGVLPNSGKGDAFGEVMTRGTSLATLAALHILLQVSASGAPAGLGGSKVVGASSPTSVVTSVVTPVVTPVALASHTTRAIGLDERPNRYRGRKSVLQRRDCLEITTETDPLRPLSSGQPAGLLPRKPSSQGATGGDISSCGNMPNKGQGEGVGAGGCSLSREQVKGERVHSCEAEKRASSTARDVKLEKELTEPGVGGSLPVKGVLWDAVCRSWSDAGIHQGEGPSSTEKGPVLTCRILRRSDFDGRLQNVNKGCPFTDTFPMHFYMQFVEKYPQLCAVVEDLEEDIIVGYILAKVEVGVQGKFGHVSALTVRPKYRKRGIASRLMGHVEAICASVHDSLYVDLYVKESNTNAVAYYKKLGYVPYRRVVNYYSDGDAFDMRKSLPLDGYNSKMRPRAPVR